jgi:hypothetical protein
MAVLAGEQIMDAEMSTVPFERVIWDAQACADYLGQSYSQFVKRTQYQPGFPARCPVPGQPRWRAIAVTDWAIGEQAA